MTQSMVKLEEFIGCTIKCDITKMTLNISQPDISKKMTQGFNKDVKSLMTFNTPDTPHQGIVCNQEKYTNISDNLQKIYRSGVVSLLYLVKNTEPELSNAGRELSKCMDKENMRHYKALLYATKYKIDTKDYCYWMKLGENINGTQELCGYSDADYAGDNDTRKTVKR